jgi:hypothetical protein
MVHKTGNNFLNKTKGCEKFIRREKRENILECECGE